MTHVRDLKSFVAERERQLDAKVMVAAQNRPQSYRATLERKFAPNSARTWPMHYEMTRHDSNLHEHS